MLCPPAVVGSLLQLPVYLPTIIAVPSISARNNCCPLYMPAIIAVSCPPAAVTSAHNKIAVFSRPFPAAAVPFHFDTLFRLRCSNSNVFTLSDFFVRRLSFSASFSLPLHLPTVMPVLLILCTIFAFFSFSSSLRRRHSDPGSLCRLFCPLPITVRAFTFVPKRRQPFLPLSTLVDFFVYSLLSPRLHSPFRSPFFFGIFTRTTSSPSIALSASCR